MCIFLYSALRERAVVEGIKPTTEKTHRGNPIKRAKWHLGIRSQSKPQDIMNEVYRAMKTLNFVSLGNCRKKLAFFLNQTFFFNSIFFFFVIIVGMESGKPLSCPGTKAK